MTKEEYDEILETSKTNENVVPMDSVEFNELNKAIKDEIKRLKEVTGITYSKQSLYNSIRADRNITGNSNYTKPKKKRK